MMNKFDQYRFDRDQLTNVERSLEMARETVKRLEKMKEEIEKKLSRP